MGPTEDKRLKVGVQSGPIGADPGGDERNHFLQDYLTQGGLTTDGRSAQLAGEHEQHGA